VYPTVPALSGYQRAPARPVRVRLHGSGLVPLSPGPDPGSLPGPPSATFHRLVGEAASRADPWRPVLGRISQIESDRTPFVAGTCRCRTCRGL